MLNVKCLILLSCLVLFLSIYVTIIIQFKDFEQDVKNYDLFSSVSCTLEDIFIDSTKRSSQILNRRCKFKNLCYKIDDQEFVFIFDKKRSLLINLPEDRFSPTLQYLGSVEHNKFHFNYVEVNYSDYKELFSKHKLVLIKDWTLIFSRFKPDNLMHSLHDDLVPLYHTLKSSNLFENENNKAKFNLFFFDDYFKIENDFYSRSFYSTLFKHNANLFYKYDFKAIDQLICFEKIEIGLKKETIWYDYGFTKYQSSINKTVNEKQLIQQYADEMKSLVVKESKCNEFNSILLSRRRSRLILNEDELIKLIDQSFNYKVIKVDLENVKSLENLIRTFKCTKLMIGMHGAGLIFSMFLPKNSILIELFPYKINSSFYTSYKQLANILDLNYFSWSNKNRSNNFYNFKYLKEEIKDKIERDIEVEQTKCCDEPYFMFRIYQDTVLDQTEMKQLFYAIKDKKNQNNQNRLIAPSKVQIINCSRISLTNQTKITLNWTKPWNTLNLKNIQYDLLVNFENQSNMFSTKDNRLVIDVSKFNLNRHQILIWIRAKNLNLNGPFDDRPVYC